MQSKDCKIIGELIGQKILITEFPAFLKLAVYHENGDISERSFYIATYALCGFANIPGIGIQIGGFGAMAPGRKSDFAQIALRAMVGGCWVSFLNACIAGVLIDKWYSYSVVKVQYYCFTIIINNKCTDVSSSYTSVFMLLSQSIIRISWMLKHEAFINQHNL